ncbi:uncharacterized protein LOC100369110 [Saccoglossus kowalevskii]|uniref:Uncharacterized protein LOC100369110 n=1 Tax=Saccoglossus kowalevskii TaxID=10224 RepID=A0ABM0N1C9_SACKO|nr:PREDICTED: uncharacterized protein LOC100369110 [Saccoglossus kowalevskii]
MQVAKPEPSAPVSWPTFENGEDYYHYLKCQVLEEQREFLCKHLRHDRYFAYLRSQRVLDADMCEEIELPRKHAAQVNKFVDCLINQGGPHAFDHFIESLKKRGTEGEWFIIRQLVKGFEQVKASSKAVLLPPKDDDKDDEDAHPPPIPGSPGGPILPILSLTNDTETPPKYLHFNPNPTYFHDYNHQPPS